MRVATISTPWLARPALRDSGDADVGPLLEYVNHPETWDRCCAIADEAGASAFVALDLVLAYRDLRRFARLVGAEQPSAGGAD